MGISVHEALSFNGLCEARVLAGENGMDRVIKRVSVLECPDYDDYQVLLREGDFFLTSFYAVKDSAAAVDNIIKILVEKRSSGLCIIDAYLDSITPEIKAFADEVSYPVLLISRDVPYADIITDIMDAIIQSKDNTILEMKINEILQSGRDAESVAKLAREINPSFKRNLVAVYCKANKGSIKKLASIKSDLESRDTCAAVEYRKGMLVIMSFEENNPKFINARLQDLIKNIEFYDIHLKLGVSNVYAGLQNFGMCINEAIFACEAGHKLIDKNVISYNNLGVYKFLLPLQNRPELKKFHDEIIPPVMEYDTKNNSQLFRTAEVYIKNDGSIRKTADEMYQHINTIRYRLSKIKEILKMSDLEGDFYEQLSIAVKLHKVI